MSGGSVPDSRDAKGEGEIEIVEAGGRGIDGVGRGGERDVAGDSRGD